jgi:hypothetical protein
VIWITNRAETGSLSFYSGSPPASRIEGYELHREPPFAVVVAASAAGPARQQGINQGDGQE